MIWRFLSLHTRWLASCAGELTERALTKKRRACKPTNEEEMSARKPPMKRSSGRAQKSLLAEEQKTANRPAGCGPKLRNTAQNASISRVFWLFLDAFRGSIRLPFTSVEVYRLPPFARKKRRME
jgi:hypothetical protein